jgi:hypothetical protein
MKYGKHTIKSHMTLTYAFMGMRLQEGWLTPVEWNLSVDIAAVDKKTKVIEDIEYKASVAYQKIYFWLDTNLPGILAVDVMSDGDLYIANLTSNIMMYCPGNPGDDMISRLLHSKINALVGDDLIVGQLTLGGNDTSVSYSFNCTDGEYMLPKTTEEYYTEGVARDKTPWWMRDDGFCSEFIRPKDIEISNEELFQDIVDPMTEFNRIIEELSDNITGKMKEPAKIVQVEKWKPKTV